MFDVVILSRLNFAICVICNSRRLLRNTSFENKEASSTYYNKFAEIAFQVLCVSCILLLEIPHLTMGPHLSV